MLEPETQQAEAKTKAAFCLLDHNQMQPIRYPSFIVKTKLVARTRRKGGRKQTWSVA
jgi:hypothetical protein